MNLTIFLSFSEVIKEPAQQQGREESGPDGLMRLFRRQCTGTHTTS